MDSAKEVGMIPVERTDKGRVLVRAVADVREGTMPGEYDRYHMRRVVSLTANVAGGAIRAAGEPPRGVTVGLRGRVVPLRRMSAGRGRGLAMAAVPPRPSQVNSPS